MGKKEELLEYRGNIKKLQYTINILKWELKITAPEKSVDDLIDLIMYYEEKLLKLETSSEYGKLLNGIIQSEEFYEIDEAEQKCIGNLANKYIERKKIPNTFYTKYVQLKNKTNFVWKKAKAKNDYELFKPYLASLIDMTKKYYSYIRTDEETLYDVMLNQFEVGITSKLIDKLFNEMKRVLIPLIQGCESQKSTEEYNQKYTEEELIDCAKYILDYMGFDLDKGTIGIYPHGFTEKMASNDVRIAFKQFESPFEFLYTIIHEGGHGLFEQNVSSNLSRYSNKFIENLYALHESQAGFYESILGKNINFWIPIYDEISKRLRLNMDLDEFMKLSNITQRKLIRTESDELTSCMHIILRYEIERDIFNNNLSVDDIPKVWNEKMKEYLGLEVDKDSNGLMQDVHWSEGEFGYFPSYLLGKIYEGMFKEAVERDLGNIDEILRDGRVKEITNYLIDKIYKNGGSYTSLMVIKRVCKKELSAKPIISYYKEKYSN